MPVICHCTLPTKIYSGHFERGGTLAFEDQSFTFRKQLFKRELTLGHNMLKSSNKTFLLLDTSLPQTKLAVHKIQGAPSFDMLVLATNLQCDTAVEGSVPSLSITVPASNGETENALIQGLQGCAQAPPIYFESQDFAN